MKGFLAIALIIAAAPAVAQKVESGSGNWNDVPVMKAQGTHTMSPVSMGLIEDLAASGECSVPGLKPWKIDLTVPFVVQFRPDGGVEHVVVRKLGCERLEGILAGVILQLTRQGEYRPTGENDLGWYRSELNFSLQ